MSRLLTLAAAVGVALGAVAVPLSNHAPAPASVAANVHARLTNEVVTPPVTNIVLSWNAWYNRLQIQHATNVNGPWCAETNILPVWPTNVVVPATNPVEFFRLAIICPGTNAP